MRQVLVQALRLKRGIYFVKILNDKSEFFKKIVIN